MLRSRRPALGDLPSEDDLDQLDVVQQAVRITQLARQFGTLPSKLARRRRAALIAARHSGAAVAELAQATTLSPGRISQLTAHALVGAAA
jgi:hypothetical protein